MHFNLSRVLVQIPPVALGPAGRRPVRDLYVRHPFRIRYWTPPRDGLPKADGYTAKLRLETQHAYVPIRYPQGSVRFVYTFPYVTASVCMKRGHTFS